MNQITTHILDTSRGCPASAIAITFSQRLDDQWHVLANGETDEDGRISDLLPSSGALPAGIYRMHFETGPYFQRHCKQDFYPFVDIVFKVAAGGEHYHIPLLLSPYGYTTYRGS